MGGKALRGRGVSSDNGWRIMEEEERILFDQ